MSDSDILHPLDVVDIVDVPVFVDRFRRDTKDEDVNGVPGRFRLHANASYNND
jgi:hypothetical protein